MSDTPRTDAFAIEGKGHLFDQEDFDFAAMLERELAEAKAHIAELESANGAAQPCRGESTQTMNTETNPTKTDGSTALAVDACYALLWIHTHYQTGEPLQIDVTEWNGRVDVLEQLTDDAKISDLDLAGLKREDWIHVRVEYSREETDYSLRLFPHNAGRHLRPNEEKENG